MRGVIEDSEAWQAKQCAENVGKYLSDVKCEPVLRVGKEREREHKLPA